MRRFRAVTACLLLALCAGLLGCALLPASAFPSASGQSLSRSWAMEELSLPKGTVAVNSADLYELTELPGVGETIAQAIIDEREANGWFRVPEDLLSVRGIGPKKLAAFRDLLDMSLPEE